MIINDRAVAMYTGRIRHAISNLANMDPAVPETTGPAELRAAMVTRLIESGRLRTPAITQAVRDTQRHTFVADADRETAYNYAAVSIRWKRRSPPSRRMRLRPV
ncbi:hypothetical protein [Actinomadura sp. NPDC000600]|uniref:hypothetical protein n=1 Tax=Actinomadura sp. NPDC000600 TaxID=3154262 RepID=UPI00339B4060